MNIQEQGYPSLQSAFVVVKVPCLYFPSLAVMLQGKLVSSLCIISTQKIVCWLFPSTLRYILPIDLFPVAASSWYTVCCGASLGTPRKKQGVRKMSCLYCRSWCCVSTDLQGVLRSSLSALYHIGEKPGHRGVGCLGVDELAG